MLIRLNDDYLVIFHIKMETKITFLIRIQNQGYSLMLPSQVTLIYNDGVFRLYAA